MENEKIRLVKERVQICSMIEYLDSINNGSEEAADKLKEYFLEVKVGDNQMKIQFDTYNFNALYNMLLTLRDINSRKMNGNR